MGKYVAFLRGVNVGGRVVKMTELKDCFEKIGFQEVKTLLQSGNVSFKSNETKPEILKSQIEAALAATFHYPAKAQVLALKNVKDIAAACPYPDDDEAWQAYVIFLENGLEKDLVQESIELTPGERVQAGQGVVYWRCARGNTLHSQFGKFLSKTKYREFNTNRNLRTLRKLVI